MDDAITGSTADSPGADVSAHGYALSWSVTRDRFSFRRVSGRGWLWVVGVALVTLAIHLLYNGLTPVVLLLAVLGVIR